MGDPVKAEEFREGEGQDEDVPAPSAQFRRHFPFQETGVAARDDDPVTILVVEGPKYAAPAIQSLDLVEKEKRRRFSGDLLEGGQQRVDVGGGEIRETVVFEIDKEDIFRPQFPCPGDPGSAIHVAGFPARLGPATAMISKRDPGPTPGRLFVRRGGRPFLQHSAMIFLRNYDWNCLSSFIVHQVMNNFYHFLHLSQERYVPVLRLSGLGGGERISKFAPWFRPVPTRCSL
jgi:hypothetical protein